MTGGYSGTPLPKKLGIREGHEVGVVGAPGHFATLLEPLPENVRIAYDLRGRGLRDVLVIFVRTVPELRARFRKARERLRADGGLWVVWPKRTSRLAGQLRETDVRTHGLAEGLVDNKICAIDSDWSGLRFVVRLEDRS